MGLRHKAGESVMIVDPLLMFLLLPGILCSKLFGIPIFLVVTDLLNFMSSSEKNDMTWIKKQNIKLFTWLCNKADGYIVLTPQMCDLINKKHKPFLVMEGLTDILRDDDPVSARNDDKTASPRIIMYAGGIYNVYGVELLIKAFLQADLSNVQLHFYGWGDMVPELEEICKNNPAIVFKGSVPHQAILEAEKQATLLINPRPAEKEFTKYSFPSKNLEYMASGTPLLAFMLPGIPEEYRDYMYIIEKNDPSSLARDLEKIMGMPQEELNSFGARTRSYVLKNKNCITQADRMLSFIESTLQKEGRRFCA